MLKKKNMINYKSYSGFPLFLFLILTALLSCGSNNRKAGDKDGGSEGSNASLESTVSDVIPKMPLSEKAFRMQGKVINGKNELVVLSELTMTKLVVLDSTRTDAEGNFEFGVEAEKIRMGFLTINNTEPPGVPIAMKNGEKLQIELEPGQFIRTEVKGDKHNMELKRLYDLYMGHNESNFQYQQSLNNIDPRNITDSLRMAVTREMETRKNNNERDIWNFIKNSPTSAATYFASTFIIQEPDMSMLDDALAKLQKDMPEEAITAELDRRINSVKPLSIGGLAPDIELTNPDGKVVKLSSLRGKVVLIDFWASWCRPCRMENPNVVRVYQKYKNKGFDIYGVSLDRNMEQWKGAIQQDGLTWNHVSDLKGWQSSAAQLYKVNSIPKTFLLDQKGRIIAVDLRGPALEQKLEQLFN